MDVAIVSRQVYPLHQVGGLEKHTFHLVTQLAERSVNVDLFCMDPGSPPPSSLQHPNITVTYVDSRDHTIGRVGYVSFIAALRHHSSKLASKDVVHFQKMVWGIPYGLTLSGPLVYTPHGLEEFKHKDSLKRLLITPFNMFERLAARCSDQIVSLGPGNTREIIDYLTVDRELITEIPNGVDTSFFMPKSDPDVEKNADWTLLTVARLVPYKGVGELISALIDLTKEMDIELIVIGEGPDRPRLEVLAEGAPVRFTGFVEEERLPAYYSIADAFVLPTFGEGMPLTLLESMACGTPVVSTQSGSIPDFVDETVGELVEPKSRSSLQSGIQRLLSRNLDEIGENCRNRAVSEHSWGAMADATIDLYKELQTEE